MVDTLLYPTQSLDLYEHGHNAIYDEWGYHASPDVSIDFILPTGVWIQLEVPRSSTIDQVKKMLWTQACQYPLFNQLVTRDSYIFNYINKAGLIRIIADETRHLSEIDLFEDVPLINVVKAQGDIAKQKVITEIQKLSAPKDENELNYDEECVVFRKVFNKEAENVSYERDNLYWKDCLERHYPPTLVAVFHNNEQYVLRSYGLVEIVSNHMSQTRLQVNPEWETKELTLNALQLVSNKVSKKLLSANPNDYVLRTTAKEYIIGTKPLYSFKSLRDALVVRREKRAEPLDEKLIPKLTLVHVAQVRTILPQDTHNFFEPKINEPPPVPEKNNRQMRSVWQLDNILTIQVIRCNLNIPVTSKQSNKEYFVHMGVYHGTELLCKNCYTKEPRHKGQGNEFLWSEILTFEMKIEDLPRSAHLCMAICTIPKNTKIKESSITKHGTPIAWVNMTFYDFRGYLKTGKLSLKCWDWAVLGQIADKHGLYPQGAVIENLQDPEKASTLEIQLTEFPSHVRYPEDEEVLMNAAVQANAEKFNSAKSHIDQLKEILKKSNISKLSEHEIDLLWKLRLDVRELFPEKLPKVLAVVKWRSRLHVASAQALLTSWPNIPPCNAMELLKIDFADLKVREFAVRCLTTLSDDDLIRYLLQLVQALKFESHADSHLTRFLLGRAWRNRTLGHHLFYTLKAELSNKSSVVMMMRFCVMIEAYLTGNISHLHFLYRQNEAFIKMKAMNERVKGPDIKIKDIKVMGRKALKETAAQDSFAEALSNLECPLDPNIDLIKLIVDDCKVMNSKMRPLWLVFHQKGSDDPMRIIYKNGDDLRQDMLTLQIVSIMDKIWKDVGLDLKMLPYRCLATGSATGLIEVISPATTVANIQKSVGARLGGSFRHQTLLEWIEVKAKEHGISRDEAIENFTYSCAGYCVATYVLGVGDRHSDNIMVTEQGQLFHIDFGHILGNFKSKYGFKRERVPFVLAHDFVHVINKGKNNEKATFDCFRKLCDTAFLALRKQGSFIIIMHALMLYSGLPELTSQTDLDYLRETLALHVSEEKALAQFHDKFKEALAKSWSTSVNWFFHNVTRDNL